MLPSRWRRRRWISLYLLFIIDRYYYYYHYMINGKILVGHLIVIMNHVLYASRAYIFYGSHPNESNLLSHSVAVLCARVILRRSPNNNWTLLLLLMGISTEKATLWRVSMDSPSYIATHSIRPENFFDSLHRSTILI